MERHVCPAAEEDQGTGLVRQIPLEHFDMGFALGIKDKHWLEPRVRSGPDIPAFSITPASTLLYQPQPTALSRRPEEMRRPSHLAPVLSFPFLPDSAGADPIPGPPPQDVKRDRPEDLRAHCMRPAKTILGLQL